jgi:SHS family lactate transporter-like MFS transporter
VFLDGLTVSGIAYGGTYGLIMAMVLEAIPERTRGVVAGSTQQGFSAGYLIASGLHLAMGKNASPFPSLSRV